MCSDAPIQQKPATVFGHGAADEQQLLTSLMMLQSTLGVED
jgi:hypothetical protein